jgi:CRP-like cAMP-binding protein
MLTVSQFRDSNEILFSFGEVDETVYVLVNGWVTLSLGSLFEEQHTDVDDAIRKMQSDSMSQQTQGAKLFPDKIMVSRRSYSATFDQEAAELDKRVGAKGQDVFNDVRSAYEIEDDKVSKHTLAKNFTKVSRKADLAYIQAPAFFGENVLWYETPPSRNYSAKCLTRSEFATLTKHDIDAVVEELPYARKAYEIFRDHILAQASNGTRTDAPAAGKAAVVQPARERDAGDDLTPLKMVVPNVPHDGKTNEMQVEELSP